MKTLYLTDLDGTLLNSNAKISKETADILNFLSAKGLLFTVATARTYSTVVPMFKDIDIKIPLVLMNGVCIYDIENRRTIDFHKIDIRTGKEIVDIFEENHKYPLMYFNNGDSIQIEYKKLLTQSQINYVNQRKNFYNKQFIEVENYSLDGSKELVYAVTLDKKDEIYNIYSTVKNREDVICHFYPDNYYRDEYFLEIFNKDVSKASGALQVKKLIGADRIIAFGDNLNDLPLFEVADEAYAVNNACDELKKYATGIIDTNDNDAVAKYLLYRYENGIL